jgi:hypothetical protein
MIEAKEEDDKIWQCKGFVDEVVADAKYESMRGLFVDLPTPGNRKHKTEGEHSPSKVTPMNLVIQILSMILTIDAVLICYPTRLYGCTAAGGLQESCRRAAG